MPRTRYSSPLLLAMLFPVGTCLADDFPLTVIDDRGEAVEIQQEPQTVASISSFGADVLAALGKPVAGLSVLGGRRSDFLGHMADTAVNLGEVHQTNLEILHQLDPDLVIGLRTYTEPFAEQIEQASPFLAVDLITLEDSLQSVERTTKALGAEREGQELNERFLAELEQYSQQAPGNISAVFLWHWGDVPYAFYNHHLTTHIMNRLGATNIQGDPPIGMEASDSVVITLESLLQQNPDVILSFKADDSEFTTHPGWMRLKAVQNGRAWRVGDQYVMSHGPLARRMVLQEMAHLLYPETFPLPEGIPEAARTTPMKFQE